MTPLLTGGCLCRAVTYAAPAKPKWTALCHCDSCRRAASAPVVAWMGFEQHQITWTGSRRFYESSAIATRSFCPTCGSPLSFQSTRWPGELHLYAASLDDPAQYRPQLHCHTAERLSWVHMSDDLPQFPRSAP